MGKAFVSYRRDETRHVAGRLADLLENRLGSTKIFMDVDAIEPGADFADAITAAVASCDVLIALIGKDWTTLVDRFGRRRLDDPDDFIVLEISAALERGICVVPVLVDGVSMPRRDELPPSLHGLVRRQAVRLDHETFKADVEPLLTTVRRTIGDRQSSRHVDVGPAAAAPMIGSRNTASGPSVRLTAADVHNVKFSKPPIGKHGYNEDEVDAVLDLVEGTFAVPESSTLRASDVHNVAFSKPPIGKRGYNEDEVDAFLDLVEAELVSRGRG